MWGCKRWCSTDQVFLHTQVKLQILPAEIVFVQSQCFKNVFTFQPLISISFGFHKVLMGSTLGKQSLMWSKKQPRSGQSQNPSCSGEFKYASPSWVISVSHQISLNCCRLSLSVSLQVIIRIAFEQIKVWQQLITRLWSDHSSFRLSNSAPFEVSHLAES